MEEARPRLIALVAVSIILAGCTSASVVEEAPASEIGLFSGPPVREGTYRLDDLFSHVLVDGPYAPLAPEIVTFESTADGATMEMAVILPDAPAGSHFPVILEASPYFRRGMTTEDVVKEFSYKRYVENFLPHGYAVALFAVRGTANQGGCADVNGPLERADLDQAVTWLGTQPWSNGNVGMIGLSYAGATAWEVASTGNPYLKTIVPMAGVNDLHDLMYRNGSHEVRGSGRFMASYYVLNGPAELNPVYGNRDAAHLVEAVICPEIARGFAASAHATVADDEDPLGFWASRNARPGVEENYRGTIYLVQGLDDWNVEPGHTYPWIKTLEARGIIVKHLLGQWGHRWPDRVFEGEDGHRRMDFAESLLNWFDRWLKEDANATIGPRVEVQDTTLAWRSEESWPPEDAAPLHLYLTPGGGLATEPTTESGRVLIGPAPFKSVDVLMTDRRELDPACGGCAYFESDAFGESARVAGFVRVPLTVTPVASAGHVAAWLYVLHEGERTIAGWGGVDLRYAAGDGVAREVVPGEALVVRLELEPMDMVVPEGARVGLLLHQGGYGDRTVGVPTSPVWVEVGGDVSFVEVPTVVRGEGAFFLVPDLGWGVHG